MKKIVLCIFVSLCCTPSGAQTYTLQQLKDSALRNNIAIRSAQHDIEASQQQRKEAFTKYFPNVSGTGAWFNADKGTAYMELNSSEMIPESMLPMLNQLLPAEALAALSTPIGISMMKHGTIAGITALQPVFAGGKIVNGNRLAKVGEEVSRLKLQLTENEVEKQTEQYYWQLITLQEKIKTIDAVDALLADIAKDVSVAVSAGVALRNDLLQVQLRQNDIASQRLKVNNGISIIRLLLAQYCGIESEKFIVKSEEFASTFPADMGSVGANSSLFTLQYSLNNLPEYQLLQKQVEATTLQKKMAMGEQLPTFAVGAGYNYHTLMGNNRSFGMVFATVSVPISDWWGGSHAVKRKKIAQQKAEEQLADNSELLRIRMEKARNDVEEALMQIDIAQRSVEQAEENLRLNRNYYRAGTSTMSNLLEAQLLYQQSLDGRTDAYAAYQNAWLEYKQAAGQNR